MSLGLNILLIFIFLLLGSVFAGTELALVSLRGSQIDQMEQEDARGKRVAQIARDPNTFLSTVQIGVTLRLPVRVVRRILNRPVYRAGHRRLGCAA